jgi:hypothetical protein
MESCQSFGNSTGKYQVFRVEIAKIVLRLDVAFCFIIVGVG